MQLTLQVLLARSLTTMLFTILTLLTSTMLLTEHRQAIAQSPIPIRDLNRNPGVTIAGEVTSIVGNEFILDDGTGQIIVDAGPRWYHQINLRTGEQVIITGEYDDYDFDAFTIIRENGHRIFIRDGQGPPPWSR